MSVVTIFLNAERFIEDAIRSVVAQSYENWELLLVDDGSADASTAIAQRYAEQNPRTVRYLAHRDRHNRGMAASRNLGIGHARGEYIAFLDADDVWLPHKLQEQVAILDARPDAALVYGRTQYWYGWTGNPDDAKRDFLPDLGVEPDALVRPPALLTHLYPLGTATAPCLSSVILRRAVAERVGGFEESFRGMYEDQTFLTKVYLSAPVFVASACWDRYRQHPESCLSTATRSGEYHAARLRFLEWLEGYLSAQGVADAKVWESLRRALRPYHHPLLHRLSPRQLRGRIGAAVKRFAHRKLSAPARDRLGAIWRRLKRRPPVGWVRFGSLRRLTPVSRDWGYDRGRPIDRYYIENFLAQHAHAIRGRVLEVQDNSYTRRLGGDRVTASEVLSVATGDPRATLVADLARGDDIPSNNFDCVILTQTLHLIYDVPAAIATIYRILKPGGVALVTVPGISRIARNDVERWGSYWHFSKLSARRVFEERFPPANVDVEAYGNVLAATAFLHGLAAEELRPSELEHRDQDYEVTIAVRAVKPQATMQ